MRLHDLAPAKGARKAQKRVGRGIGGKGGKTAGKGTKGQQSRGRGKVPAGFEGGQVPLYRRTPKLPGFTNPFRVEYKAINLDTIAEFGESEITPDFLIAKGAVGKSELVKVLGSGSISSAVTVKAHAFSASAKAAIEAAGGTCEVVPKPFAVRPAAKGNQHTNR